LVLCRRVAVLSCVLWPARGGAPGGLFCFVVGVLRLSGGVLVGVGCLCLWGRGCGVAPGAGLAGVGVWVVGVGGVVLWWFHAVVVVVSWFWPGAGL
jgi:uncharacterized protein YjeT (DUF2065 family)